VVSDRSCGSSSVQAHIQVTAASPVPAIERLGASPAAASRSERREFERQRYKKPIYSVFALPLGSPLHKASVPNSYRIDSFLSFRYCIEGG
jgi:hypothetical protein